MKSLFLLLLFLSGESCFCAPPEISLTFEKVPHRDGYRLYISATGTEKFLLAMRVSETMRQVPMDRTDTYYSDMVTIGPRRLTPLSSIALLNADGSFVHKNSLQGRSLLDLKQPRQPDTLVLQAGDKLALHEGFYRTLPAKVEARIVIFNQNGWEERVLLWKQ